MNRLNRNKYIQVVKELHEKAFRKKKKLEKGKGVGL